MSEIATPRMTHDTCQIIFCFLESTRILIKADDNFSTERYDNVLKQTKDENLYVE